MNTITRMMLAVALTLAAGVANAEEVEEKSDKFGSTYVYDFGFTGTLGEGFSIYEGDLYRGPLSAEVVASFGWDWVKFDLGVYTRLESVEIERSNMGFWNFSLRPGGRLTPPMLPLFLRVAVPLQMQKEDFDWGFLFGIGADVPIAGPLGIVLEVDNTLSHDLDWGRIGMPVEFRAGLSLHF